MTLTKHDILVVGGAGYGVVVLDDLSGGIRTAVLGAELVLGSIADRALVDKLKAPLASTRQGSAWLGAGARGLENHHCGCVKLGTQISVVRELDLATIFTYNRNLVMRNAKDFAGLVPAIANPWC